LANTLRENARHPAEVAALWHTVTLAATGLAWELLARWTRIAERARQLGTEL
jgi:hypothetical protein